MQIFWFFAALALLVAALSLKSCEIGNNDEQVITYKEKCLEVIGDKEKCNLIFEE